MKTSEILRLAADKHLSPTGESNEHFIMYSCDAIDRVFKEKYGDHMIPKRHEVFNFLRTLGLNPDGFYEFGRGPDCHSLRDPETQGARFLWLDFAALVAEDMGD